MAAGLSDHICCHGLSAHRYHIVKTVVCLITGTLPKCCCKQKSTKHQTICQPRSSKRKSTSLIKLSQPSTIFLMKIFQTKNIGVSLYVRHQQIGNSELNIYYHPTVAIL